MLLEWAWFFLSILVQDGPSTNGRGFIQVQNEVPGSPIFMMQLCQGARHIEVQIVGDEHGNAVALKLGRCGCHLNVEILKVPTASSLTGHPGNNFYRIYIVRKDSPSQQCSHFSDGTTIQNSTVEHGWTIAIVCWTPCETKKPPFVHIDSFAEERPRLLHPAPLSEDIWGRPPSRGAKGDLLGNGTSGTAPHAKHRLHWGWTLVSSVQRSGLWT